MIITVPVAFELPAATILELLGDVPPVPVFCHPVVGRSTVSGIHLEEVEAGGESERAHGHGFPEADPLDDATVLINGLSLLEVERGIRVH